MRLLLTSRTRTARRSLSRSPCRSETEDIYGRYMLKIFFGKDHEEWFQKRLMLGAMIYAHKEKALNWVKAIQQHESLGRLTIQDFSFRSIPSYEDLIKARENYPGFYQRAWHRSPYDIVVKFRQEKNDALTQEKEAVRRRYEGAALWMKAPNGVQTNLTEAEWLTVRTPSFKAAFGDWEALDTVSEIRGLSPVPVTLTGKTLDKRSGKYFFDPVLAWRLLSRNTKRRDIKSTRIFLPTIIMSINLQRMMQHIIFGLPCERKRRRTVKKGVQSVFCT